MSDKMSEQETATGSTAAEKDPTGKAPTERDATEIEGVESVLNEAAGIAEGGKLASEASPNSVVDAGDATKGSAEDAATIAQLRAALVAEQNRYEELNDRFQRSTAEFQNTLRRRDRQMGETVERASQNVVIKLLPVVDDFERAFQNLPEGVRNEHAPWLDGFLQIQKKLQQVLEDEGVTAIPVDGLFDPNVHEAVTNEPSDSVESGHIIATLRIGYQQRGRVIRPALVRVAA